MRSIQRRAWRTVGPDSQISPTEPVNIHPSHHRTSADNYNLLPAHTYINAQRTSQSLSLTPAVYNMSASQIPNLNTLRRGGGGLRGRLRGRGRGSGAPSEGDDSSQSRTISAADQDKIIQGTDTDASVSRLSAVELGYLDDAFARTLTPSASGGAGSRRFPIINRGKYCPP